MTRLRWIIASLIILILLAVRLYMVMELPNSDISHFQEKRVAVMGIIDGEPRISQDAAGAVHIRYVLNVETVEYSQKSQSATGKILVYSKAKDGSQSSDDYGRSGDRMKVRGEVQLLHDYQNPGRINWIMSQRSQEITAQMMGEKDSITIYHQEADKLWRWIGELRDFYRRAMEEAMSKADAAAIFAMLFGGYAGIKEELLEAFTLTGIIHILSVSGSHITLLAGMAASLGRIIRLPTRLTIFLTISVIVLYSMLAGMSTPVIRAAIMGIITLTAMLYGKKQESLYALVAICASMLIYSPLMIYDISFQLSFGATAGILILSPVLRNRFKKLSIGKFILPKFIADSLSITIGAQLSILPLLAWYFNVISLTSLLANIVVVPLIEWIIVMGLLAGLLGAMIPFAGKVVFIGASLLLGFVYEITKIIAGFPGSRIYLPTMNAGSSIIYYAIIIICIQENKKNTGLWQQARRCKKQIIIGLSVCIMIITLSYLMKSNEMQVHFIDCGQGDSCLVITPHGHAFMIDTGGSRDKGYDIGKKVILPYLLHYGVTRLDCIFLTHAHDDHAAGVGGILGNIPVEAVFIGHEGKGEYMKAFGSKNPAIRDAVISTLQEGSCFEIDGVEIQVLYSPTAERAISTGNATGNEYSNLFRVSYGRASFLITGDLVKEQENALLSDNKNVEATVLKVGHHGSRTSSSPEWLRAVSPIWCVISCGYKNSFGHPHDEVLAALSENTSAKVLRTDLQGAIIFKTDGIKMKVQCYNE